MTSAALTPRAYRPAIHEQPPYPDMQFVPGGTFRMGSDVHYPEEAPAHEVCVGAFWIDSAPVTNHQFAQFVRATGYRTLAETPPNPADHPNVPPELLGAGSLVFSPGRERYDLRDWSNWWSFRLGAYWRRPYGKHSSILGLEDHPVVHIAYEDAAAYARWSGKDLPSEAEWEFAARGGLEGAEYAWGDELMLGGQPMANTWQGRFPYENLAVDGYVRTSPIRTYAPNGYSLYDMIGNVWEWTADRYAPRRGYDAMKACCVPNNPIGGRRQDSFDPANALAPAPRKVIKGGSFLSAPNYCRRYRPAARHAQAIDAPACHLGFRCIVRVGSGHQ